MFCKTPWEREFMIKNLTKKFVNVDLKKYNEDLFVERQISLLPDTQKEAIKEKKIREIRKQLDSVQKEKDRLKVLVKEQDEICRSYTLELSRLYYGTSTEDTSNVNFTIKCCREECNGFLDDKYHCELCETNFCKMCM
jgi:CRISPR/Cas system CMR subunit Cmr6 (Cas7 group RAMP superfamily)